MIDRRQFLRTAALLATAPLAACRTVNLSGEFGHGVDAHCHVFNASDLPAARFIRFAFLEHYPETEGVRLLDIQDPSVVDRLIQLFLLVLRANEAPTAAAETAVLDGKAKAEPEHASEARAAEIAIGALAGYLRQSQQLVVEKGTVGALSAGEQKVLGAILRAGGGGVSIAAADKQNLALVARNAFFSPTDVGTYLRWFNLFTLYRHVLVDRLASDAREQGLDPTLLAPATVDYDRWLGEFVEDSPLREQVAVMGRISRRQEGPAVHGYFGFDPLREIYFRERRAGERQSPLALARSALTEHGFLGIKLYPPMGFRASGNAGPYPSRVWNELGGDPSRGLDAVLRDLYRLCVELDAPILAHAYASNGANKDFELRADPAYWLPVFRSHPTLRVCLAHFGGFDIQSAAANVRTFPEASWEWTFGRHVKANPAANVVADLSFFTEVLQDDAEKRRRLASNIRRFVDEFDQNVEHLVYGSDWVMIGMQPGYDNYARRVDAFLRNECGFGAAAMERFFRSNALRFMGLGQGEGARRRLLAFYRTHGLDEGRLPLA